MKLKDFFDLLLEEAKIDDYISIFNRGSETIRNALLNGITINHHTSNLINSLKQLSEIAKEFHSKKEHSPDEKEKYSTLISAISNYNKLLNIYNNVNKENKNETVGDCFRQLGANTKKKSIKTEIKPKRNR